MGLVAEVWSSCRKQWCCRRYELLIVLYDDCERFCQSNRSKGAAVFDSMLVQTDLLITVRPNAVITVIWARMHQHLALEITKLRALHGRTAQEVEVAAKSD